MVQEVGNDDVQDRIAQEFEPFIGLDLLIGALAIDVGAVGKGHHQVFAVLEAVTQDFLQFGERSLFRFPFEELAEESD
jgi:hypothetical protein